MVIVPDQPMRQDSVAKKIKKIPHDSFAQRVVKFSTHSELKELKICSHNAYADIVLALDELLGDHS